MYVTSKSGPTIGKEAILAFIPLLLMRFDEVEKTIHSHKFRGKLIQQN